MFKVDYYDDAFNEGYKDGYAHGLSEGYYQGQATGIKQSLVVFKELGEYYSKCKILRNERKFEKVCNEVIMLIDEIMKKVESDVDIMDLVEKVRVKWKVVNSLSGVKVIKEEKLDF